MVVGNYHRLSSTTTTTIIIIFRDRYTILPLVTYVDSGNVRKNGKIFFCSSYLFDKLQNDNDGGDDDDDDEPQ